MARSGPNRALVPLPVAARGLPGRSLSDSFTRVPWPDAPLPVAQVIRKSLPDPTVSEILTPDVRVNRLKRVVFGIVGRPRPNHRTSEEFTPSPRSEPELWKYRG